MFSLTKEKIPNNSVNIENFAKSKKIPYYETEDINILRCTSFLSELDLDFILSFWPHIILENLLTIPKFGIIGTHPTNLPRNKGRHPLHWLIVLGKKKSMMSFFKMNEVIDGGDILIQEQFDVGKDINEANSQMIDAGKKGLEKLIKLLKEKPNYIGNTIQKESGNYLRKRDIHDITIDPRMTSNVIKKIVNSFCYPYPLARLYYQKNSFLKIIKINELSDDECSRNWKDYEHGYIFKVNHNSIDIRVDNMVLNMEIEVNNIDVKILLEKKIHPPAYYFNSDS